MFDDADSTVMSILYEVAGEHGSRRRASLERFCQTYTLPLVNYLVRAKRLLDEDAADLVHDFWISKMLKPSPDENLVSKFLHAQQFHEKSSFRSYLSVALNNFLRSKYRSANEALLRSQVSVEQLDGWEAESPEDLDQFDIAWANHILVIVLEKVRHECNSERLKIKWTVFTKLILQPIASNQPRPSYAALAAELGIQDTKEIGNSLTTFKRIFMRHLEIAVKDYLPANSREESRVAAKVEVAMILAQLSKAGGLQLPLEEWGVEMSDSRAACSLVLNNLAPSNLIQNDRDYQAAWSFLLSATLSTTLGIGVNDYNQVTLKNIIDGDIRDIKLLERIRSDAKRLGLSSDEDEANASQLNRKLHGLIYFIAIVAAKLNFNQDISSQTSDQLASLAKSFANENWIDENTRLFLRRYQLRIEAESK